jgi:hypothetical protein
MLMAKKTERDEEAKKNALKAEQSINKSTGSQTVSSSSTLPSHTKTLNEIVKIEMLLSESDEGIAAIWNTYHSTRDALSASLDASFYDTLYKRSKSYPIVFNFDIVCLAFSKR